MCLVVLRSYDYSYSIRVLAMINACIPFFFFFLSPSILSKNRVSNFYNILSCRLQICLQFASLNNASYVYIYNIFALFFINSLLHETIKPFFPRYVLCLDFRRVFAHLLRLYEFHVKIPFLSCYFLFIDRETIPYHSDVHSTRH